jgi:hypothetical protein
LQSDEGPRRRRARAAGSATCRIGGVEARAGSLTRVRRAGGAAWRFAEDLGQLPHAVLYIRDAIRLPVEPGPAVPPALIGEIPDRSDRVEPSLVRDVAQAWATWWDAAVELDARAQLNSDMCANIASGQMGNPATSPALNQAPVLRVAAASLFDESCEWAENARQPLLPPPRTHPGRFDWQLTWGVAEAVAGDAGVDIGAINGAVSVLLVEGFWWKRVRPQFALCSFEAADDPEIAEDILRDVFTSGLATG